ncbi:MAG TPA: GNAT family N-acetyltransferase [Candidatus Acidoferrales bacterium]|nr:GNAT family N-acetyltransferase [Candidatus Acidoferrales bacterium]
MEIRRITRLDAEALWKLRFQALEDEPAAFGESAEELHETGIEAYAERISNAGKDDFIFGAFAGSGLIGMAGFFRLKNRKEQHKGWIWGVYVSPEFRARGAGRALLQNVVQAARDLPDVRVLHLKVAATQQAARNLYLSLGFRSIGVEPLALRIDDGFVDEDHLILQLAAPDSTASSAGEL